MSHATTLGLALGATYALLEVISRGAISKRLWRELATAFIHMELLAQRLMRLVVEPRFVVTGDCHKCGDCCRQIVGDPPRFVKASPLLLGLFVGYHRVMHNFQPRGRGPDDEIIFACGYLESDGRCGIYRLRPFLCRNYPVLPYYEQPRPLPGCGYGVAPRVVAKMKPRASLRILNHTVAVHHPTRPGGRHAQDLPEHYERVAVSDGGETPAQHR